jgi:hypothetical protein
MTDPVGGIDRIRNKATVAKLEGAGVRLQSYWIVIGAQVETPAPAISRPPAEVMSLIAPVLPLT